MPSLACVHSSPSLSLQKYVHEFFEGCSTKVKGYCMTVVLSTTFGSSSELKMLVPI